MIKNTKRKEIIDGLFATAFLAMLVIALGLVVFKVANNAYNTEALNDARVSEVTIQANDTLWTIAESLEFNGLDNRKVIDRVLEMNDMKRDDTLSIGDTILVPVNDNSKID